MAEEPLEEQEGPTSLPAKIFMGIVVVVALAGCAWLLMRMSAPVIRPDQPAPAAHWSSSCTACHRTSPDAKASTE